jgi:hypothetical protein
MTVLDVADAIELNLVQANRIGCHVIPATHDLLAELHRVGCELDEFSCGTVYPCHSHASAAESTL